MKAARALDCLLAGSMILLAHPQHAHADGSVIDKIYHPYVQPMERELELRATLEEGGHARLPDRQTWRLGYGQALNDNWLGELYLIGEQDGLHSFRLSEYEVEALWQLTEQGQYAADWGLLFEFATMDSADRNELATTLLAETQWQRWTGTANLSLAYEYGSDIANELDSELALQARYRLSKSLEPAVEFYGGEGVLALGPILMGDLRLGAGRQLHWEGGLLVGLKDATPDRSYRLLLEYEF